MDHLLGTPYIYGGNNPLEGMDCSGAVLEVLKAVGIWKNGDTTSQGLYDHFAKSGRDMTSAAKMPNVLRAPDILFFGESKTEISHVALYYGFQLMWESGGGGSSTKTLEDAKKAGAFVRLRPMDLRGDLVAILRP